MADGTHLREGEVENAGDTGVEELTYVSLGWGLGAVADENVRTFNWIISTFSVK